jgi:hypothetical protein
VAAVYLFNALTVFRDIKRHFEYTQIIVCRMIKLNVNYKMETILWELSEHHLGLLIIPI